MSDIFDCQKYTIRKKFFKMFGASFHIMDDQDNVVMFASMKAFKLKEDIRLYTGEDKLSELLTIQARQVLDISATYDVLDARTNDRVGALRRRGFKSILKDEWLILDTNDNEIGMIKEDSLGLALLRRLMNQVFMNLIPQKYHAEIGQNSVCAYQQNFNPFIQKIMVDFSDDFRGQLDRRLGLAAGVLLSAIEGKQH
ncbi:MAG: hypothetical protein Q7N50_00230 [Armatimonadota bacterium]|nr:hypothetical protein [Armatimonadota bacterium]